MLGNENGDGNERKIWGVEVFVNKVGSISIRRNDEGVESCVAIQPQQARLVARWIKECAKEALS